MKKQKFLIQKTIQIKTNGFFQNSNDLPLFFSSIPRTELSDILHVAFKLLGRNPEIHVGIEVNPKAHVITKGRSSKHDSS